MNLAYLIPLIAIGASCGAIAFVLIRSIPRVKLVNPLTVSAERERKVKDQILLSRLARVRAEKFGGLEKGLRDAGSFLSKTGRRLVQRVYRWEQYYEKIQKNAAGKAGSGSNRSIERLMQEGEDLMRSGDLLTAEKRFIEVIGLKPKHVKAYERLGNLYLKLKQFSSARETLQFAHRLAPGDASLLMSLGEVEQAEGKTAASMEWFKKAVEKSPTNPKYLDAFIEASIASKHKENACAGLSKIESANPDNGKIEEWKSRIAELSQE